MSAEPIRIDRRHRRREETIEEVVDVAVELMGEQGAAGLSLGEVARRMGVRTPSLYGYFASKNALYDAVFARGWRLLLQFMEPFGVPPLADEELPGFVLRFGQGFVRWAVEHPAYSQLLFWRPVPGYQPSAEAYVPAVELFDRGSEIFVMLRERGLFGAEVDTDEAFRVWTMVTSGVISQQLSNAPHEPFDGGTFTSGLSQIVAMFLAHYGYQNGPTPGPQTERRRPRAGTGRSDH